MVENGVNGKSVTTNSGVGKVWQKLVEMVKVCQKILEMGKV